MKRLFIIVSSFKAGWYVVAYMLVGMYMQTVITGGYLLKPLIA